MDDAYSVSAIITSYNRKAYALRAIRSVLNQSHLPDEIILIDDGSTDGTGEEVAAHFPEIRYFWQENEGISAARNHGIQHSSNPWIGFLDCDDEWMDAKLERQLHALKENSTYRICYTDEIWIRRGRRVNPKRVHQKFGGDIFEKCLPLCIISPSSVLIHHEVFRQYGVFDSNLPVCEDYDLWLRVCAFLPVLYLEDPLIVKYGGHADQLSHQYWGMDRFRIRALEKLIEDPRLEERRRVQTLKMLIEKIDIYLLGAKKRKKHHEVVLYREKLEKFVTQLEMTRD